MDYASKEEVNGLGNRLNKLDVDHSATKTKTDTNEKNINQINQTLDRVFDKIDTNYNRFSEKANSIGNRVIIGSVILVIGVFIKDFLL